MAVTRKSLAEAFRAGGLLHSVGTLLSGSAGAKVIGIFLMPVVSRLFTPADFGVAVFFVQVATVIATVCTLAYAQSIVLADQLEEAQTLTRLSFLVLGAFCVVLALPVTVYQLGSWEVAALERLGGWLWCLPLAVALTGLFQIVRAQSVWMKRYPSMARAEVAHALTLGFGRVGAGLAQGTSVVGLIGPFLAARALRVAMLWPATASLRDRKRSYTRAQLSEAAYAHRQFPLFSAPTALVRNVSDNLPLFFMMAVFSPAVMGVYALAQRLVHTPIALVQQSMRQVFTRHAAEKVNAEQPMLNALLRALAILAALGVPIFLTLFLLGEPIFKWVLGEPWALGGRYAGIVAPWWFTSFVVAPATATYIVLKRQSELLRFHLLLAAARVAVLAWAWRAGWSIEGVLWAVTIVSGASNLCIIARALLLARRQSHSPGACGPSASG